MKKRKGFLFFWLLLGLPLVSLTGAALFFIFLQVLQYEKERQIMRDEIFIAQEVLQKVKYNVRFGKREEIPLGETERNGRIYKVELERENIRIEGIFMTETVCRVSLGSRRYEAGTLLENSP